MRDSILIALLGRCLTHREIATRIESEVALVRKACDGLMQDGLLFVGGDKQFGTSMYPAFELTSGGEHAARAARVAQRNAKLAGTAKTQHDSVREAG